MSTSLQRQLASLASASTSLLVPERRRSSIIFSPQDAAKYDRETFYQIGNFNLIQEPEAVRITGVNDYLGI